MATREPSGEPIDAIWKVMRQDDTGNRFVVETNMSREAAEQLAAELEARGHKQLYWAEPEEGRP